MCCLPIFPCGPAVKERFMCYVYVHADPIQYEARTRSIRISNVVTTIRLENLFWDVLAEIAGREGKTTNQMIATLYEELTALREDNPNFTSFLRVCCLRYLSLPRVDESAQLLAAQRTTLAPAPPVAAVSVQLASKSAALAH
jgi:predicted DNA-binding ribbon-helix-helix protein